MTGRTANKLAVSSRSSPTEGSRGPCLVVLLDPDSVRIDAEFGQPALHVLDHCRWAADVGTRRELSSYSLGHHGPVDATVVSRPRIACIPGEGVDNLQPCLLYTSDAADTSRGLDL